MQSFLDMWVLEETGKVESPEWLPESFAQIEILDHDFAVSRPEETLYNCVFHDGAGGYGYIIVSYDPEGPAMGNWSVRRTWERIYDFRAHADKIFENLQKTDVDMETVTASRVYFFDREKRRADQVVRFTDAKGDNYLYYFGDESYMIEKFAK